MSLHIYFRYYVYVYIIYKSFFWCMYTAVIEISQG